MSPTIQYQQPDSLIWQLLYDKHSDILVAELRNETNREVSYTALKLNEASILWEGMQPEETWWVGAAAAIRDTLFLYEYDEESQLPTIKSTSAYSLNTGQPLWTKEGYAFEYPTSNGVVVRSNSEQKVLDFQTGKELTDQPETLSPTQQYMPEEPTCYQQDNEHFQTLERFLLQKAQAAPYQAVWYHELDNCLVLAFSERTEEAVRLRLMVFSLNGELLYQDTLDEATKEVASSPFITIDNHLIYIKNKQKLICLPLKGI
ncbi:DUF4905 domain-containing protein [Limibacter armeniacum]|uniref:DUF4905 domain-containing protein n=1 Tax=Limibacter armeniacum TaxID=466084 RepID=UPI002FE50EFE